MMVFFFFSNTLDDAPFLYLLQFSKLNPPTLESRSSSSQKEEVVLPLSSVRIISQHARNTHTHTKTDERKKVLFEPEDDPSLKKKKERKEKERE